MRSIRSAAFAALLVLTQAGHAKTWIGNGANNNWSTTNNWGGGSPPVNGQNAVVEFDQSGWTTANQNLASPFTLNGIYFNRTSNVTALTGNTINFVDNVGINKAGLGTDSTTPVTIYNAITLVSFLNVYSYGQLTLSGPISGNQGLIVNSSEEPGTVTLAAANTYFGATEVDAGTLVVASGGSLSNTSSMRVAEYYLGGGAVGALAVSGGSISTPGYVELEAGSISLTAGSVSAPSTYVDHGVFTQTGGSHTVSDTLKVGRYTAGRFDGGAYNLSGTGQLSTGSTLVGTDVVGAFNQTGGTHAASSLILGFNSGISGAYTLSGGALSAGSTSINNGSTFTQTGGSHSASSVLSTSSGGSYSLSDGTVTATQIIVGFGGSGSFSQTGGSVTVTGSNGLFLARFTGASGTYDLSGGSLSTVNTRLGINGPANFTQTGGTHTVSNILSVGSNVGGGGTYDLGGAGQLNTVSTRVGEGALGSFIQSGGSHTISGALTLGYSAGISGSYAFSGGQLSPTAIHIGESGSGDFIQTGGTLSAGGALLLGYNAGSNGTYTLSGGILEAPVVTQGAGTGAFHFDGGALRPTADITNFITDVSMVDVRAGGAVIDTNGHAATIAQPLLHDSALGNTSDGGLTKKGSGTLTLTGVNTYIGGTRVSGGTLLVADDTALGAAGQPVLVENGSQFGFTSASVTTARTFTLNAASLTSAAGQAITYDAATINGGFLRGAGTHILTGGSALNGATVNPSATVNQIGPVAVTNFTNNGNYTVEAGQTLPWDGGANTSAGRLTINGTANVGDFLSNGVVTINGGGAINNNGSSLVLGGGSRTTINASGTLRTASGTTIELNGGLLVNNGTVTGPVNVNYGSLAKGTGSYDVVNVNEGGVYYPGNSPGISTAASVSFQNGSFASGSPQLVIEMGGAIPGTQYSQLHVSGMLTLGGTLDIRLVDLGGGIFSPSAGDKFDILDWGGLAGTFSQVQLPTLTNGIWNTSQLYTTGVISVEPSGLPGDYNHNGIVDAADYVAWRKSAGTQSGYDTWRSHFGQSSGSGVSLPSVSSSPTVPEASTDELLLLASSAFIARIRFRRETFSS